jgi:dTDP-4-dehydrorhamnose reductase
MSRVLIIGVDGALGRAAMERFAAEGHVVTGTTRRPDARQRSLTFLDLEDSGADEIDLPACDVAIICAAMARFAECRAFPERARRVNVTTPLALAGRLARRGSKTILLSTSAVFDGAKPHVLAETPTSPRSAYGRLKAEAEAGVLAIGAAGSVLRLSKVISSDMALLRGWIESLKTGRAIRAFSDLTISPIAVDDVTTALLAIAADGAGGIYQMSGAIDVSYFDFARRLANALGADVGLVETDSAIANGVALDEILRFTSLDANRLARLIDFAPPHPDQVLDLLLG